MVVGGIEEALEELESVIFASFVGAMVGAGREEVGEEVGVAEEAFFAIALVVGSSLCAVERKRRARITA